MLTPFDDVVGLFDDFGGRAYVVTWGLAWFELFAKSYVFWFVSAVPTVRVVPSKTNSFLLRVCVLSLLSILTLSSAEFELENKLLFISYFFKVTLVDLGNNKLSSFTE